MQSDAGIPQVFNTFREVFHKQRRSKRHVTENLGLLLEMYERWHLQFHPHCDFETFITRVANLHGKPGGKGSKGASLKVRC
jgi:Replication Fork Protection Component Swi3